MLMLDLCSGLGGASAAMIERGWSVITVDIEPKFKPSIIADIRNWSWPGKRPDLIWASPPCVEFSRESMPWSKTGNQPDMSIIDACKQIIQESKPIYWIIENVRGAIPYLGKPRTICGPFYLWGFFPDLGEVYMDYRPKESFSSNQRAERAKIPHCISNAVAIAIELSQPLILEHDETVRSMERENDG